MSSLAKQVLTHMSGLREGTPLAAKELLHLGRRAAVDQVLSRLVQRGALLRAGRGLYVLPVRAVYLTSGPSRRLNLGAQTVELRHAPIWRLLFPGRAAGDTVRALAWLGPDKASEALSRLRLNVPPAEISEVVSAHARLPTWIAREISALAPHG